MQAVQKALHQGQDAKPVQVGALKGLIPGQLPQPTPKGVVFLSFFQDAKPAPEECHSTACCQSDTPPCS